MTNTTIKYLQIPNRSRIEIGGSAGGDGFPDLYHIALDDETDNYVQYMHFDDPQFMATYSEIVNELAELGLPDMACNVLGASAVYLNYTWEKMLPPEDVEEVRLYTCLLMADNIWYQAEGTHDVANMFGIDPQTPQPLYDESGYQIFGGEGGGGGGGNTKESLPIMYRNDYGYVMHVDKGAIGSPSPLYNYFQEQYEIICEYLFESTDVYGDEDDIAKKITEALLYMNITAQEWIDAWEEDTTDGVGYGVVKLAKYLTHGVGAILAYTWFDHVPFVGNLGVLWEDEQGSIDDGYAPVALWGNSNYNLYCDGINNVVHLHSSNWTTGGAEEWFIKVFPDLEGYEWIFVATILIVFPDLPNPDSIEKGRWEVFFQMAVWAAFCQDMAKGYVLSKLGEYADEKGILFNMSPIPTLFGIDGNALIGDNFLPRMIATEGIDGNLTLHKLDDLYLINDLTLAPRYSYDEDDNGNMCLIYSQAFDSVKNGKPNYARFEIAYGYWDDNLGTDYKVVGVQGIYDRCISDDYVHVWVKILVGDNAGDETDGWMPITWYANTEYNDDGWLACIIDGLPFEITNDDDVLYADVAYVPIAVTIIEN